MISEGEMINEREEDMSLDRYLVSGYILTGKRLEDGLPVVSTAFISGASIGGDPTPSEELLAIVCSRLCW